MSSQSGTITTTKDDGTIMKSVLLVEDDDTVARMFGKVLRSANYDVVRAADGLDAMRLTENRAFDAIVTDISMPHLNGIELLKAVHMHDEDMPVVLVTGNPETATAIEAVRYRALRYLVKPVNPRELTQAVAEAIASHEEAALKTAALPFLDDWRREDAERAALQLRLDSALDRLYMVYQPIVCPSENRTIGYEALVRTEETSFAGPGELLAAAEELDEIVRLGRRVRTTVAGDIDELTPHSLVFVNLHPFELQDEELFMNSAPLVRHASRVVYEITERACLESVGSIHERLARLRTLGFRLAVDDLGSGYSGLSSFVSITPEFVKIDMELIRDVDKHPSKRELVRSLVTAAKSIGSDLICEGVETIEEAGVLTSIGAVNFQGYLFSPPKRLSHWSQPAGWTGLEIPEPSATRNRSRVDAHAL